MSDPPGPTGVLHLRLLRSVLDHATDAVLITEAEPIDQPGPRIVYANAAFARMTGYEPHELLGQTPRIFQGPRSDRHTLDQIRAALAAWQPTQVELINYHKCGTEFWVELSIAPVADERGWYTHWIAIQRDITARKRAVEFQERGRAEVLELSARGAPLDDVLSQLRRHARHLLDGRPVTVEVPDPSPPADMDPLGDAPDQDAATWLPILGDTGRLLGRVTAVSGPPMTADDRAKLAGVAQLASLLIERDHARLALEDALRRAELLTALGDVLQQAMTPGEVAAWAMGQLGPALRARSMLVIRLDGERLQPPILWGDVPHEVLSTLTRAGMTLADAPALRMVAEERQARYVDNDHALLGGLPALGYGVEPLCTPDGALQGFLVAWRAPGAWSAGECALMRRAAETVGLALERAEVQVQREQQREHMRQATVTLQRERTFLQAVLANLSEGVVACDAQGQLTLFNDATRRFHGLDASPLPPQEWSSHYALFEADGITPLTPGRVPLYRAWRGERVREAEMVIRPQEGPARQVLVSGQPMVTPSGEALGAVVTMRDITARRAAEGELRQRNRQLLASNAELRAANEELEALAYSASHDLRTPVRHVKSFAELARRALASTPNEKADACLSRVETAAERMSTMIDALTELARSGKQPLKYRAVALRPVVERVRQILEADGSRRVVDWQIGELPVVPGDQGALQQALTCLLANALKFSRPRDRAVIEVWSEERPEGWAISVRDNGVGFEPEYAGRLFGAFQRLHTEDEFGGTGIGLATVRRIVLRHGGTVFAHGVPGQGATFGFTLPGGR